MCIKNKEATWIVFWHKVKKTINFLESEGDIYLASDDVASLIGHMYGFGLENTAEEEQSSWELRANKCTQRLCQKAKVILGKLSRCL